MIKRFVFSLFIKYYDRYREKLFESKSNNLSNINGTPKILQPVLFLGKGKYIFQGKVQLGYFPSPYFYSGNIHLEARTKESVIEFGNNIFINNNFVVISEKKVKIGNNALIGTNVEITDSDFHNIIPAERFGGSHFTAEVEIKDNVWIGSNVKILKGVTIGENSVIANGSIVTGDIPANVVAGGIPAKVIKQI
jgi:maltose O-acetyltransferase